MEPMIKVRKVFDDDPDLTWLDQTDEQMSEGFESYARERKEGYARGNWHMVGVIAEGSRVCKCGESTVEGHDALWGIESDSREEYFLSVAEECAAEVASQLGVEGYEIDWSEW